MHRCHDGENGSNALSVVVLLGQSIWVKDVFGEAAALVMHAKVLDHLLQKVRVLVWPELSQLFSDVPVEFLSLLYHISHSCLHSKDAAFSRCLTALFLYDNSNYLI